MLYWILPLKAEATSMTFVASGFSRKGQPPSA